MYMQFQSIYVAPHWKVQEQRGKEFSTQICQKKKKEFVTEELRSGILITV